MPEAIPFPHPAARLERRRILNDTTIRTLKPPASESVDYFDDATPGLSLRVYDRYGYDAEKRAAMEFWNRQLTAILKGKSTSDVRRFTR